MYGDSRAKTNNQGEVKAFVSPKPILEIPKVGFNLIMKLLELARTPEIERVLIVALTLPLLQLIFPHVAYAQVSKTNPAFEIKIEESQTSQSIANGPVIILENEGELTTIISSYERDLLHERKQLLRKYLTEVRPSPLAAYVDVLAVQPHWRRIVAISFVESTMCKRHYYNNCWGITYSRGLAKYPTFKEAIVDTNRVLEKYSNRTYRQMNGVYVQPYNPSWGRGVEQIEAELDKFVEPRVN